MKAITIAPLGTPGNTTAAARAAILGAAHVFLQTEQSLCAAWLKKEGIAYTSMDDLYDQSEDFDALNRAVAARLTQAAGDAVYAVCGRMGDAAFGALLRAAEAAGLQVLTLPAPGYAQAALCALPEPVSLDRYTVCTAGSLPAQIDPYHTLCIEEVAGALLAGDVKLALAEYYGDAYPVWFCALGKAGYAAKRISVCELDRQPAYDAACCAILGPAQAEELPRQGVQELMRVLERLRAPGGCPWDAEQTHLSLRGPLIEEAYEVLDAIEREDDEALCEELGDLLLQVALHSVIAEEQAAFTLRDVTTGLVQKLIYRHPHVFGGTQVQNSGEVLANWEQLKRKEKRQHTTSEAMQAVPRAFPALMRSAKVQKKAAHIGFDWDKAEGALEKLYEEAQELQEAMAGTDAAHVDEELGDLLFAAVNVARLLKRDPEAMLHAATDKFMRRFSRMEERILQERGSMEGMTLSEMDQYWNKIKQK
ncbi:MAG: nucleoside triphosphate pyrophosphohydrolase [Christensenellaceae bacterium]|jgi:tetrapyrrole methylase family protein/MazG family protein|nr:nucleoside triphosphate pyrophosphohydrolase [Christensenellaceae bacterium]